MTRVHLLPISEPRRQVPPGNACSIAVEDRLYEQSIVLRGDPNVAFPARKQVLNPIPLVITDAIAAHGSAPRIS
jgi:hypothetical protein